MDRPELLEVLCRDLPDFRRVADRTGRPGALAAVLDAARRGEPIEDLLRTAGLLSALNAGTSRNVVPADEGLVAIGVSGTGGHVTVGAYRCPADLCARVERPAAGDDMPECAVHRRSLRFDAN